jgi:hypothetical protein
MGTGSANSASLSRDKIVVVRSPFIRVGSISMKNRDLRISYDSFGKTRSVIIAAQDLMTLVSDRLAPATQVLESNERPGGIVITFKVGYACRSVSGKALKISTTTSCGELMVPWANFLKVINGVTKTASVSRIEKQVMDCPPATPSSSRDIRAGLSTGF